MNHSPGEVIAADLVQQEIAKHRNTKEDWSVFVDHAPSPSAVVPKSIITVINTAGPVDGRYHGNKSNQQGKTIEHPGIHVVVRSENPSLGWSKANEISKRFDAILRTEVIVDDDNDYIIQSITKTTSIVALGEDPELRLFNHSMNAIATLKLQET